jgi:hypothetical protein
LWCPLEESWWKIGVGGEADGRGELAEHEFIAAVQLAEQAPPAGIADGGEKVVERNEGSGNWRAFRGSGTDWDYPKRIYEARKKFRKFQKTQTPNSESFRKQAVQLPIPRKTTMRT